MCEQAYHLFSQAGGMHLCRWARLWARLKTSVAAVLLPPLPSFPRQVAVVPYPIRPVPLIMRLFKASGMEAAAISAGGGGSSAWEGVGASSEGGSAPFWGSALALLLDRALGFGTSAQGGSTAAAALLAAAAAAGPSSAASVGDGRFRSLLGVEAAAARLFMVEGALCAAYSVEADVLSGVQ